MQNLGTQCDVFKDIFNIDENEYFRYVFDEGEILDQICEKEDKDEIVKFITDTVNFDYYDSDHKEPIQQFLEGKIATKVILASLVKLEMNYESRCKLQEEKNYFILKAIREFKYTNDSNWEEELANARGLTFKRPQNDDTANDSFYIGDLFLGYHIEEENLFLTTLMSKMRNNGLKEKAIKDIKETFELNSSFYNPKYCAAISQALTTELTKQDKLQDMLVTIIKCDIHHGHYFLKENAQYPLLKQIRQIAYGVNDYNWEEELAKARAINNK